MKVLVFDIWADYGHFRKYFTTSSPLTYSIIPPTAMYGILGAILGLSKEENQYLMKVNENTVKYGVQIVNPIKKIRLGMNYINTKGKVWIPKQRREGARTQIRTEFLKNPYYRCYIHLTDEQLFNRLIDYVKEHKTVFSTSLGLSECLANFRYVRDDFFQKCPLEEKNNILTSIPASYVASNGVEIEEGKTYMKERVATAMSPQRVVSNYEEVIFEPNGMPIKASISECYQNEHGDYITFIN
ncbi:type I-B CRISPR-associated protein Cas5b [Bacillus sp. FJAT-47783]|uniref:type I-B CRISPR-associated protein Cas5b n=1 Tax=Bacillus sp. FJAT-47783 TaxID=2922712 RepID=UPI001FADCD4F|nr:type I-B CRISPR-associated protein Cas5b [Bacillus sp. FJAT-47783]